MPTEFPKQFNYQLQCNLFLKNVKDINDSLTTSHALPRIKYECDTFRPLGSHHCSKALYDTLFQASLVVEWEHSVTLTVQTIVIFEVFNYYCSIEITQKVLSLFVNRGFHK